MENTTSGLVFPQGSQIVGGSPGIIYNYVPQQIPNYVLNGENIVYLPAGFGVPASNPSGQNFVNGQNNGYPVEQTSCILPGSVQTLPQVTGISSLAEVVGCPDAVVHPDESGIVVGVRRSEKQRIKREPDDDARNRTLEKDGILSHETEDVERHLSLFSESMLQSVSNQVQEPVQQSQQMQQQWQQYLQQQIQQKLQLQPQMTLVNLKLPNGQVLPGYIQNTTYNNVPAWSVSPPGSLQGLSSFWPGNRTQVQGFPFPGLQSAQIQGGNEQVIANAHTSQNLGLASNTTVVSNVPGRQPAPQIFPNMAAYGPLFKVQKLQPDATDPSKWCVIAEDDNLTSGEVSDTQSDVIDSTTPSPAFPPYDEALAKPPASSNDVPSRTKKRRQACPCANCLLKRSSGVGKKNLIGNHICSVPGCGKVYKKSGLLKTHLLRHSGLKPYACEWVPCGKRFSRTDDLRRHHRCHTGERRHECVECKKRFLRSDHLTKHMRSHLRPPKKKAVVNDKKT